MKQILLNALDKIQEFAHAVEEAILSDDFEVISVEDTTTTIEVSNIEVEVWMVNDPSRTRVYRVKVYGTSLSYEGARFKKPHLVRNAITAKSIQPITDQEEKNDELQETT